MQKDILCLSKKYNNSETLRGEIETGVYIHTTEKLTTEKELKNWPQQNTAISNSAETILPYYYNITQLIFQNQNTSSHPSTQCAVI